MDIKCFIEKVKVFLIKVFHIKTYEKEVDRLYAINKEMIGLYEDIVASYKRELEEANDRIYKLETLNKEPLSVIEATDRIKHKSYAKGRWDAYSEMGIKALDARVDGNTILVDETGKLVEVVTVPTLEEVCMSEGIDLNDLENVSSPYEYVS